MSRIRPFQKSHNTTETEAKHHAESNLTAFRIGRWKTNAYLRGLGILEEPICSCQQEAQSVDHLMYSSTKLKEERKKGRWSVTPNVYDKTSIGD